MTIHAEHPFRDPGLDPTRQLRGRIGGAVTLWTAPGPAGLTVSSVMVATGSPAYVVALLDPVSDLFEALSERGVAVMSLLRWPHRDLAQAFAGLSPAPGGPFAQAEFVDTTWGPRLADAHTWAGLELRDCDDLGRTMLVTCQVRELEIGDDDEPLEHRRGRYQRPGASTV